MLACCNCVGLISHYIAVTLFLSLASYYFVLLWFRDLVIVILISDVDLCFLEYSRHQWCHSDNSERVTESSSTSGAPTTHSTAVTADGQVIYTHPAQQATRRLPFELYDSW